MSIMKMKRRIYFAGPLHDPADQARNTKYVKLLREAGYDVYLPQEHGIWEEFPNPEEARHYLFKLDMDAMQKCDTCIVCCGDVETPRAPSEGAMFEMGWCKAANKTVLLYNEKNYWRYNLMPQYGADIMFDDFGKLLQFLNQQDREVPTV